MTKEEATKELKIELSMWESDCKSYHKTKEALKMAIKALEQESFENAYKQVVKERDIAIEQLNELGYSLGEKIEPCNKVRAEVEAQENG